MKPNNPSNREDLLHLIRQSLAIEDTFGNAVLEIMRRMSTDNRNDPDAESTTQPVPVYEVAAFVDGTLDDPQKTAAITKAAAYDPGLMMEIIAAIRSREEKPAQRLSSDLRSRLLALQPPFHADTASTQAEFPSTPAIVPPPLSANLLTSPLATPPATTEASNKPPSASTRQWWAPLAGLATAAAVVAAVGWWFRSGLPVQTAPIASDPVAIESPEMNAEGNVNPDSKAPSSRDARPPMLARDSGSGLASPPDIASENPNLSRPK